MITVVGSKVNIIEGEGEETIGPFNAQRRISI